jgi:hypothetical protein
VPRFTCRHHGTEKREQCGKRKQGLPPRRQHPFSRRRDPQRRRLDRPDVVEELTPRHHQAATHEPNQDVGRDVLGRENSLSAATGVGSDDLERTTPDVGRTLGGFSLGLYSPKFMDASPKVSQRGTWLKPKHYSTRCTDASPWPEPVCNGIEPFLAFQRASP